MNHISVFLLVLALCDSASAVELPHYDQCLLTAQATLRDSSERDPRCDDECVNIVRGLLELGSIGFSVSYLEKQNDRLGDRVGVALLRIFSEKDIADPDNVKIFLPVIREAFLYPEFVSRPENRIPTTTLPLLRDLERRLKGNPAMEKEISETISSLLENKKQKPEPPSPSKTSDPISPFDQ
jgi:hypothetical protein